MTESNLKQKWKEILFPLFSELRGEVRKSEVFWILGFEYDSPDDELKELVARVMNSLGYFEALFFYRRWYNDFRVPRLYVYRNSATGEFTVSRDREPSCVIDLQKKRRFTVHAVPVVLSPQRCKLTPTNTVDARCHVVSVAVRP